jgi:hypothetical protein
VLSGACKDGVKEKQSLFQSDCPGSGVRTVRVVLGNSQIENLNARRDWRVESFRIEDVICFIAAIIAKFFDM